MKLTQKAVAALTLPVGKTDHFEWDEGHARFRLPVAPRRWRQDQSLMDRAISSWRCHPAVVAGPAAVLGAEQARVMAKKALGRVANGEDPQADGSTAAARTGIRQGHRRRLSGGQAARGARAHLHRAGALSHRSALFQAAARLALDQITRKDVAAG